MNVPPAGSTIAESVRSQLERAIVSGTLRPGERLDEQEIATRFGASRTPVREAIRALAASGLVDVRSRQGATVGAIDIPRLIEMFQVMAELEGLCGELAARRITAEEKANLATLHMRLVEAGENVSPLEFYEINREFHEAIYDAARNDFLAEQTRALRTRVGAYRRQVTYLPGRVAATIKEHAAVMDAIFRHDGEAARRSLRDHVNLLGDNLSDFIASLASGRPAPDGAAVLRRSRAVAEERLGERS
ncbi:MAG: GntR family transcriptional regulator [Alphaproteobacteria bacterium]|nr:GntR family transcriptional regulator [Alphaproteobacteria bacterium]